MRRILAPEDLWAKSTTNLSVRVDEADAEGRTRGARRGLHAPGPHHGVPGGGEGRCYDGGGVDATGVGEGIED